MKKIKLGVIGIGSMGRCHIKNILENHCPEIEVTAVADMKKEQLDWAKNNCFDAQRFLSGEKMIQQADIDSVLIAVPHYDHCSLAVAAIKNGKHTMIEKPAGVYTKQVREMNEAAKQSDVVFGIMFNQRTNPVYRKMREIVQSGEMGEICRTNWIVTNWYRPQAYYDSSEWRATWKGEGGGVLLNQCPHNLDLWQWICGMPVSIEAKMKFGSKHKIEVEDEVTAFAEYENGATGVFITSTGEFPGTNRFEIILDGGKLVSENDKLYIYKSSPFESVFSKNSNEMFGSPNLEEYIFESNEKSTQHIGVMNAFAGAVLRNEPLVAKGEEGLNSLLLSNAMHLSAFSGGKTVRFPFDENEYYHILKEKIKTSRRLTGAQDVITDFSSSFTY